MNRVSRVACGDFVAHALACRSGTRAADWRRHLESRRFTLQRPALQVIEAVEKPGRPINNRPQVNNLPHTARGGSVSDSGDGSPRVVFSKGWAAAVMTLLPTGYD